MRIQIDLIHASDVNFYKNAVSSLKKEHEIFLTVFDRGSLPKIVEREYGMAFTLFGRHREKGWEKIANIPGRVMQLRRFIQEKKIDVVTCFGFYPGLASRFSPARSVIFHDDPEYRMQFLLCRLGAKRLVLPSFLGIVGKNIVTYNGFKELAYLHPDRFRPQKKELDRYGLAPGKYIFARHVSKASLNYLHSGRLTMRQVLRHLQKKGYKILLSAEDKSQEYPGCILLQEPVEDIYSLIYHAAFVLSSGDTVAREGALLGVPSIYIGNREMAINRPLIQMGALHSADSMQKLERCIRDSDPKTREKMMHMISENWQDTTDVIVKNILT